MSEKPIVVVIGAGVIGLSIAIALQNQMRASTTSDPPSSSSAVPQILIVAQEWPSSIPGAPPHHSPDYASMWAGAHVRPIPASTPQLGREAAWLKRTVATFDRLVASDPAAGITRTKGIELLEAPDSAYLQQQDAARFYQETGLKGFKRYHQSALPPDVTLGFEYQTFCVNAPVYCQGLLRRFLLAGGRAQKMHLSSEWDAFSAGQDVLFVVNASGRGFGDEKCFPTRGQTIVTDISVKDTITRQHKDGTWSFLIPRFFHGGTIVGGTKEPGDWRAEPCASTREALLEKGILLVPLADGSDGKSSSSSSHGNEGKQTLSKADVTIVSDVVGRRPTRHGGMRVQVESRSVPLPAGSKERTVIHAYGAGGRGYELSWGVAEDVVALAMTLLDGLLSGKSKL